MERNELEIRKFEVNIPTFCLFFDDRSPKLMVLKMVVRHFTANGVFGKVSQQSGKVSQQVGKVSQQVGKFSQQTGKVSQHQFAVK